MEKDAITSQLDSVSAYSYLLEWEWPGHIENVLRRLLLLSLSAAAGEGDDAEQLTETDYLAARLAWLISVCPDSNPAILHALAQQQPTQYLVRIAENPNVLAETLQALSRHDSEYVRAAVAENPKTPQHVLFEFINDESVDVRYAMAENPNLSETILQQLSDDDNCYVAARANRTLARIAPTAAAVFPLRRTVAQSAPMRKMAQM